ncbi:MAG: PKD domain-containing protein [Chitinophagaceae bacterium]
MLSGGLFCGLVAISQAPVANFSANTQQGCAPLSVSFTDLSTGSPRFWNWDLGNGQLSNQQNPSTTYNTPGKYTVILVVRNANGTNGITKREYITVNASPTANLTSNVNLACSPATVRFADISTSNTGTITKWAWEFGDGTTSLLQNPQKTYSAAGFYSITLKVTNSAGCENQVTKHRFIRIVNGVKAAFKDSLNRACQAPFVTTFINQTSGPGTLSYAWNFGNGTTSTLNSPQVIFASSGTYNIQLIAKSDLGCSDSISKPVTINNAASNFNSPDTACLNSPVNFQNASAPAPVRAAWDFGDATRSTQINPVKTFTTPGVYQVKLVNTYASCTDSVTRQIRIVTAAAIDFTANNRQACKAPFNVSFQDLSPNAVSWQWNFGDGTVSTQKNPAKLYSSAGEYDVTLTITNASGCRSTLKKSAFIKIAAPTVRISSAGGCIPFTFSPVANISSLDSVISYLWDFGDGTTSNLRNPTRQYPNTGSYTIRLTITTIGGCSASVTVPNGVRTGTRPTVDFTAKKFSTCAFDTVGFTNLSNPSDAWLWRFGDGNDTTVRNPSHVFKDTGRFTITLVAYNNGCADSLSKPDYVQVLPPVARYLDSADCANRLHRYFTDKSIVDPAYGPVSYLWKFGDPANTTSTLANPDFIYPALGTYPVSLTVTNGSCSNTITKNISVSQERADFSLPRGSICKNERILLTAVGSNPDNIIQYIYSVNGGPPITGSQTTSLIFDSTGPYNVRLIVTDRYGCSDTITKIVTIEGPTARFAPVPSLSCKNGTITFNDLSTSTGNITKWDYDFGDGTTQSFTRPPFTHLYKDTGNFTVRLTVTDQSGCTDSAVVKNAVIITSPKAAFKAENTLFCPGGSLQFTDSSSGKGLSYIWDFGDGTSSTLQNPTHIYSGGDNFYTVKLSIQDTAGCMDSSTKINYVQIKAPKSAFNASDTVSICVPFEAGFVFKGTDYESFYWAFGDSTTSTLLNPAHFYNQYGSYVAKLYVTGYGGCVDSSEQIITVYDPSNTSIRYNPLTACNSLLVDFTVTNTVTPYLFYFGDTGSDYPPQSTFQHLYTSPGSYTPSLVLKDNSQCLVEISGKDEIKILGAEPFFSPDRKALCDSGTIYFTNYTIGNDPVVSSKWDFGDGVSSLDIDPIHYYDKPGRYLASLSVNTLNGCSKTLYDTIRVYRTPDPVILTNNAVCINTPLILNASSVQPDTGLVWKWTYSNGQTSTQQNPSVQFSRQGKETLNLEAANALGCKRSTVKSIMVNGLPSVTVLTEPVIPIGTGINLPVRYSENVVNYNWTPVKDLSCTNCPNPFASPKRTTRYTVNVSDSNGCQNTRSLTVTVVCNNKNYFVPNTFTPNGDGSNDVFFPRGSNIDRIQSMRIFNRFGEMIFERRNFQANNPSEGWNGFYKGKQAQADVYIYTIEFICENNTIIPYTGNISLIR